MDKPSVNKILSVFIPMVCGIVIADLFLRLYGITFSYLIEVKAVAWIDSIPKDMHVFAFWVQSFIVEALVFAIVSLVTCCIGGLFVRLNYTSASIIAFITFILTKAIYGYIKFGEILFDSSSITYFALISITSIITLWGGFYMSGVFYKRRR